MRWFGTVNCRCALLGWRKSNQQWKRVLAWIAGIWGGVSILFYLFALLLTSQKTGDVDPPGSFIPTPTFDLEAAQTVVHEMFGVNLELDVVSCLEDEFGYATIEGTVKNEGSVAVEFVQVKVMLLNNGEVVDTDSTYAVGNEGLEPGEQTTFDWLFSNPPDFDQCRAQIFDYHVQ